MRRSEGERKRNQTGAYLVSAVMYYVSEQRDQEEKILKCGVFIRAALFECVSLCLCCKFMCVRTEIEIYIFLTGYSSFRGQSS